MDIGGIFSGPEREASTMQFGAPPPRQLRISSSHRASRVRSQSASRFDAATPSGAAFLVSSSGAREPFRLQSTDGSGLFGR
jgi:hypothetical protein